MDYYDKKRRAAFLIDQLIRNGGDIPISRIILAVEKEYGLSEKFVRNRIELLHKDTRVLIDRNKDLVSWV